MEDADDRSAKRRKSEQKMVLSDAQLAAVRALELKDVEENALTIESIAPLDAERRERYAKHTKEIPGCDDPRGVASVTCVGGDEKLEHIVVLSATEPYSAEPVIFEDKILYDEVPLSQIIEYRFNTEQPWMLSCISKESLEFYRSSKFTVWKEMLMSGGNNCERAFKSMLRSGLITNIYDPVCLASPPEEQEQWLVVDPNTGKNVDIPRPVSEIRVWDATTGGYVSVASRLEGAPEPGSETKFWDDTLAELRTFHGSDTIDRLLEAVE